MASDVGAQVARRLRKLEAEVKGAQRNAVNKASLELKNSVQTELDKVVPSRRLRNVGRKGARVGVRYDIKGKDNPTSIVRATGPAHLIERGTQPHVIRGRDDDRALLSFLPINLVRRGPAHHPGTAGRYPFRRGVARGYQKALKALRDANTDALKRGMR